MPAALAVPLILGGASAATSIAGAKMASNASKNAANTQSTAADRALAAQQAGYQQQRQDFAPYQQAGTGAVGRLNNLAGQYTGGMPNQPPPNAPLPASPPPGLGQLGMPGPGMRPQANIVWSGRQQPPQMGGPGMPPPGAMSQGPQGGGSAVRVQAPTGEIAMLTPQQAQMAVQKGARVLA